MLAWSWLQAAAQQRGELAAHSLTLQRGTLSLGQAEQSGDIRAVRRVHDAGMLLAVKEAQVESTVTHSSLQEASSCAKGVHATIIHSNGASPMCSCSG